MIDYDDDRFDQFDLRLMFRMTDDRFVNHKRDEIQFSFDGCYSLNPFIAGKKYVLGKKSSLKLKSIDLKMMFELTD